MTEFTLFCFVFLFCFCFLFVFKEKIEYPLKWHGLTTEIFLPFSGHRETRHAGANHTTGFATNPRVAEVPNAQRPGGPTGARTTPVMIVTAQRLAL